MESGIWVQQAFFPQKAKDYVCKADATFVDGPWEAGRSVGQGAREDINGAAARIKAGETYVSLRRGGEYHVTCAKYKRYMKELEGDARKPRIDIAYPIVWKDLTMLKPDAAVKKRNWWIRAPPDFGKTRDFNNLFKGMRAYWIQGNLNERWELYDDEEVIIYDDCKVDFNELSVVTAAVDFIQMLPSKVRYDNVQFRIGQVRTVVVLTNKTMAHCGYSDVHLEALDARFIVKDYYLPAAAPMPL